MPGMLDAALEFVDRTQQEKDATIILADFAAAVKLFGFNHFIMTGLPAYGEDVEKLVLENAWPEAWSNRYREGRYFFHDPVSRAAFSSTSQFRWSEARSRLPETPMTQQIEAEARGMGLVDGLVFPVFDPTNWQAVVSLSSDKPLALPDRDYALVYMMAAITQGKVAELLKPSGKNAPTLTVRERDVLTWLAHGKTRGETADILQVSLGTIKTHIEHINAKLGTANTMQAIARAVRARQIIL